MSNQEVINISTYIIGALMLVVIILFLSYLFKVKVIQKRAISIEQKQKKIINLENFFLQLKNILDFFSRKKIGTFIVLKSKKDISSNFFNSGVYFDAQVSEELLKNIFMSKKTQLHDGATIIEPNYRISYVSVIFTVPKIKTPIKKFGARHNVAKTIVSKHNVIALVVSEVTGNINIFPNKTEVLEIKKGKKSKKNFNILKEILQKWQNEQ